MTVAAQKDEVHEDSEIDTLIGSIADLYASQSNAHAVVRINSKMQPCMIRLTRTELESNQKDALRHASGSLGFNERQIAEVGEFSPNHLLLCAIKYYAGDQLAGIELKGSYAEAEQTFLDILGLHGDKERNIKPDKVTNTTHNGPTNSPPNGVQPARSLSVTQSAVDAQPHSSQTPRRRSGRQRPDGSKAGSSDDRSVVHIRQLGRTTSAQTVPSTYTQAPGLTSVHTARSSSAQTAPLSYVETSRSTPSQGNFLAASAEHQSITESRSLSLHSERHRTGIQGNQRVHDDEAAQPTTKPRKLWKHCKIVAKHWRDFYDRALYRYLSLWTLLNLSKDLDKVIRLILQVVLTALFLADPVFRRVYQLLHPFKACDDVRKRLKALLKAIQECAEWFSAIAEAMDAARAVTEWSETDSYEFFMGVFILFLVPLVRKIIMDMITESNRPQDGEKTGQHEKTGVPPTFMQRSLLGVSLFTIGRVFALRRLPKCLFPAGWAFAGCVAFAPNFFKDRYPKTAGLFYAGVEAISLAERGTNVLAPICTGWPNGTASLILAVVLAALQFVLRFYTNLEADEDHHKD